MKISCIIAFLAIIFFTSCSKEHGTDNNFHVSFSENGTKRSYTGYVVAHIDTVSSGVYELQVIGATSITSFNDYMGIYISNDPGHGGFNAGQYADNSTAYTVLTTYDKSATGFEAGQSVAGDAVAYGVTIANHFKVTITAIDKKTIRGTFSGDYYRDGDVHNTNKLNITNGDFYAQFQ